MQSAKGHIVTVGSKWGRWTVQSVADSPDGRDYWNCQCECGTIRRVQGKSLRRLHSRSCGCLKAEITGNRRRTHGVCRTRLYRIWSNMKTRCTRTQDAHYTRYGGRGINVCPEWTTSFVAFQSWAIRHGYKDDLTIDRHDNSKGYTPENCRWVTNTENIRNQDKTIWLTAFGETKCFSEWVRDSRCVVTDGGLYRRIKRGITVEDALTKPPFWRGRGPHTKPYQLS